MGTIGLVVGTITMAAMGTAAAKPRATVEQVQTTSAVTLADAANTPTQIYDEVVPAGTWAVTGNLTAVNFGTGDFVRCYLTLNGTQFSGRSTVFLANRVAGVSSNGTFTVSGPSNVSFFCEHDEAATTANQFSVDPGATITAAPRIGASHVVESMSTSQTPLTDAPPVASITLKPGNWVVNADLSAVNFTAYASDVFCGFNIENYGGTYNPDQVDVSTAPSDASVANLQMQTTLVAAKGGSTVTLACTGQSSGMYVDPGATLMATKATGSYATASSSVPSNAGTAYTVISEALPAGTYRVGSEVEFNAPDRDFYRCTVEANGSPISGRATVLTTADAPIGQTYDAGYYSSSSTWTVSVACSHDDAAPNSINFHASLLAVAS